MKFIKQDERGFTSFDNYFAYIASIKERLDERLFAFASDPSRYDLNSKGSLHDAWIQSMQIEADHGYNGKHVDRSDISLTLLGPFHDRLHVLQYFDVKWSSINLQFGGQNRHKDLLLHELRWENGLLQHQFEFDGGGVLEFHCLNIEYQEHML